jgi:Mg2+ and Co2+ transporter CorA
MKKIILVTILSTALFSCSNESKMKDGIKKYLDKNAKDPRSYELVELKVLDTITAGEVANQLNDLNIDNIKNYSEDIENLKLEISNNVLRNKKYNTNTFDEFINEANIDIDTDQEIIKESKEEINKLKKLLNSKDVIGFMVHHKYRLKNGFGALDISENEILFDKDLNINSFDAADNSKKILFRKLFL